MAAPADDEGGPQYYDSDRQPLRERKEQAKKPVTLTEGAPDNSEDALALTFAARRQGDARWVEAGATWMRLKSHKWVRDTTRETINAVRLVCREAARIVDPKRAIVLASQRTVSAVERLSRDDRRLAATVEQWDANPSDLNTPGPLIDLTTLQPRTRRPTDYLTKSMAVEPAEPGTPCPTWTRFLDQVMGYDAEKVRFLQAVCGYFLTGRTSEHAFFFAYGTGANGKGVFVNTVLGVMGDYATTAPMETFMASRQDRHPTELADLHGARLVAAIETEEGRRWNESRIKQLTGGDPIKARRMGENFWQFTPQFKLLVVGNHMPTLRSVDEAIRRRFYLIPFTITISAEERDPDLAEKLKEEWRAILRWMLDGYSIYHDDGLEPPEAIRIATAEYLENEDIIGRWLEERCERDTQQFTPTRDLFNNWKDWAEEAGVFVGDVKSFSQKLVKKGLVSRPTSKARGFLGVRIRPRP